MKERSQNPILDRLDRKNKQSKAYRASPKLEKKIATKVGGRRTSASGSKREKGDVRRNGVTRIEHKCTQKKSFSVTREMVQKIELAAMGCDEVPMLVVEFLNERGDPDSEPLAVVRLQDILDLIDGSP